MRCATALALLGVSLLLVGSTHRVSAQDEGRDPRLVDLAARARANIEAARSVHMKMASVAETQPQGPAAPALDVELWREGDSYRSEIAQRNQVGVITEDQILFYEGSYGTMLRVPPETARQFADRRDAVLKRFGLPQDQDEAFIAMIEKSMVTIVDVKDIDGIPCLVLEVKPEYVEAFAEFAGMTRALGLTGGLSDTELGLVRIALETDTAVPRQMYIEMTLLQPGMPKRLDLRLTISVQEYELNADVPDELFAFEPPEGTTVVEWAPELSLAEVHQALQDARIEAAKEGPGAPEE